MILDGFNECDQGFIAPELWFHGKVKRFSLKWNEVQLVLFGDVLQPNSDIGLFS